MDKKDGKHSGTRLLEVRLKKARKLSSSSQQWLRRQLNDPYVQEAKRLGYRSRAAFKLLDLDDKFHFLKPHMKVVDLGAAPGGWTQIVVSRVRPDLEKGGKVIGIDLLEMDPIPHAILYQADFTEDATVDLIKDHLEGPADLVLSDMAPSTIGHQKTDHLRIMALVELAIDFAEHVLAPGGAFIAKVFQGGTEKELLQHMKEIFKTVHHVKPPSSRKDSAEMFVVALGFRGKNIFNKNEES
jgi:23S rRNA (uridine2552-2'-O)-methyltransferase